MYGPPSMPGPMMWPSPVYGQPAPAYGPPSMFSGMEMPHGFMGLLDKIKMKLDIFTVLKIILKLVIFKKIIKFIAILCLLMFIPSFKPKEEMNDDSMMMMESEESRTLWGSKQGKLGVTGLFHQGRTKW